MARLIQVEPLEDLKHFLGRHVGLQFHASLPKPFKEFSEQQKLGFLPMLFGLLPRSAVARPQFALEVKPLIRDHLSQLKIPADEVLVDLLKVISDSFLRTMTLLRGHFSNAPLTSPL